jgi:hypothetical protein
VDPINYGLFKAPNVHELMTLAYDIKFQNNEAIKASVEGNPRMLLSDCDRPHILHEGCRHNALHIAAKYNNHEIIAFILNAVGSEQFMSRLYPKKCPDELQ